MNPEAVQAWVQVAQVLIGIGVNVAQSLKGLIHHAQPTLTDEQINQAYAAILADDAVRSAFAARASAAP